MAVQVGAYAEADFDGVRHLWETVFPDDPSRNRAAAAIPQKLAYQPELFLVARDGATVVGSVMAGYDGHRGWLYAVAVAPGRRREGIGAMLVRAAEGRLHAMGCGKVTLQIRDGNEAVADFYRALGYAVEPRTSMGRALG